MFGGVELAVRPLNDSDGAFLSVGRTAIRQDRLSKLLRDSEFVVNRIVDDPMHGPAQQAALAFNPPKWLCSPFRQPGESRNFRMGHSIRDQDLFPFCVVSKRMGIP